MAITIIEVITIMVGIIALGVLAAIAIKRWMFGWQLRILDDYSNPAAGYRAYYAIYDKRLDAFVLLKQLLSIWPYKTIRYINFAAYSYGRRTVDCIESYTGKPGDVDVIPVHHVTPSRLGIMNWLSTMHNSMVDRLTHGAEVDVPYSVPAEGTEGRKVNVIITKKEKINLGLTDQQKKDLPKLLNLSWFATANGFLPVEDIGVLKEDIRQAAKRFYAKSFDKERENEGLLYRYAPVIAFGIMVFVAGLGMGVYWQIFFQSLTAMCQQGYCPNYHPSSNTVGSILPSPSSITNSLLPGHSNITG